MVPAELDDPILDLIVDYLAAAGEAAAAAEDIHRIEVLIGPIAPDLKAAEQRFRRAVGAVKRCAYALADTKPATPAGAAALLRLVAGQMSGESFWPVDEPELTRVIHANVASALEAGAG
jgi:hypothetical protein